MYIFLKNVVSNRLLSLITIDTFFEWFFTAIGFPLQFFVFFLFVSFILFSKSIFKICFGHFRLILKNFQNVNYEIFWKKGGKVRNGHRDALPLFLVLSDIVYIRRESERERMYIYVIELCSPPLAAFLILCQV